MPVSSASRPGHQTSAGSKWQAFPCGYLDGSDSAAVPNVHGLVGRRELLRRGLGLGTKSSAGNLCLTSRSLRLRGTPHETYRSDLRCTYCFTCNDHIRFCQIGYGSAERGGRLADPSQGRRARSWSRTSRWTRPSLRLGQRAWSSLRMVPRPGSPSLVVGLSGPWRGVFFAVSCQRDAPRFDDRCERPEDANADLCA